MRKILIVGAGYSGLTLAHLLLSAGYDVTVMTGQTSPEIRQGRTRTLAMTFPETLALEREAGLFFQQWETAPTAPGIHFSLRPPNMPSMEFGGNNAGGTSLAVESRLKMADWLEYFEDRGGKVIVHGCTVSDLEYFTRGMYDLTVIAVGAGELGALFDRDDSRTGGAFPGRITQASMFNVEPHEDPAVRERGLEVVSIPGGGNVFLVPQLTAYGPATTIFAKGEVGPAGMEQLAWEERPGRPSDTREQVATMRLSFLLEKLWEFAPDIARRCQNATLVDPGSVIMEEIRPQVRHPVATLSGGGMVLGMADAVISVDPVSGQQHANAAACARAYFDAIRAHGEQPFTPEWGRAAFDRFWNETGQFAAMFTEVLVANFWDESKRPPYFAELLEAVLTLPEIQDAWVTGVCRPTELAWMLDEQTCRARIAEARERAGVAG
ncbi:oxygenase [Streptomonospora sp. PA3]|uniref:styrene monooxygenase/indole monooxygenase family protein n=1 Tax=Streptomonospora sp. PA3 TaxID=2607326 RepID=UPI0012DC728A|nr:styrene monooxygenase/indole monooxygenase family protein [Streptomonospora sp. PA3]MUL43251.1 oxygenase [Streptomonospora sp. PA3]